ncbi:MAG: hypothetical protein WCC45_04930, partial [Paeniglutamicibacter sp.]
QMVYINRPAQVVAVKLSSWPLPQDADKLFGTLRAFNAIAAMLASETPAASQAYLPLFAVPGREHPLHADSEPRTSA